METFILEQSLINYSLCPRSVTADGRVGRKRDRLSRKSHKDFFVVVIAVAIAFFFFVIG
jgi:hypothetical protein